MSNGICIASTDPIFIILFAMSFFFSDCFLCSISPIAPSGALSVKPNNFVLPDLDNGQPKLFRLNSGLSYNDLATGLKPIGLLMPSKKFGFKRWYMLLLLYKPSKLFTNACDSASSFPFCPFCSIALVF